MKFHPRRTPIVRNFRRVLAMATLLLPISAGAKTADTSDTQPSWRWPMTTAHTYYLESHLVLPQQMRVITQHNQEARLGRIEVRLRTRCMRDDNDQATARKLRLVCQLEDVALSGQAVTGDEGTLAPILEEYDALLTGAEVHVTLKRDGRLAFVDLEGVPKSDRRQAQVHETLRALVLRAFAGLDLALPKVWEIDKSQRQSSVRVADYPSNNGALASARATNTLTSVDPTAMAIQTSGKVTLAINSGSARGSINSGGHGQGALILRGTMSGDATFDADSGVLNNRHWMVVASAVDDSAQRSVRAGNGTDSVVIYVQAGRIIRMDDQTTMDLGLTEEGAYLASGMAQSVDEIIFGAAE